MANGNGLPQFSVSALVCSFFSGIDRFIFIITTDLSQFIQISNNLKKIFLYNLTNSHDFSIKTHCAVMNHKIYFHIYSFMLQFHAVQRNRNLKRLQAHFQRFRGQLKVTCEGHRAF